MPSLSSKPPTKQGAGTGGVSKKRGYKRKESWEHIRKPVTDEVQKGTPHMSIIAELNRRGVDIELSQLKRLLRLWGLSDKNIKKQNRKWIFQMERCARGRGKSIRGWMFSDTGYRLKQTQLDRIIKSDGKEFEGIAASPGTLVMSPIDVFTPAQSNDAVFIPTPEGHVLNPALAYAESDEETDADGEPDVPLMFYPQMDLNYTQPTENTTNPVEAGPSRSRISLDTSTLAEPVEESIAGASIKQSDTIAHDDQFNADGTIESLEQATDRIELLQALCDDLIRSTVRQEGTQTTQLNEGIFQYLTPQLLSKHLSEVFRPDLDQWMQNLVKDSDKYIKETDQLVSESGIPRSEAESIVSSNSYNWAEDAPPSYDAAIYIRDGTPLPNTAKLTLIFDKILPVFYDRLLQVWQTIGSDSATLRDSAGKPNFSPFWKESTRRMILHLPYLLETYGVTHFASLMALADFIEFIIIYGVESEELLQYMKISEIVTMTLQSPLFSLAASMDNIAQRLIYRGAYDDALKISERGFKLLREKYGEANLHTITAAATLAEIFHVLKKSNNVEALRKYIALHIQQINPLQVKGVEDCTVGVYGVITIMTTQIFLNDPRDALKTGRLIQGAVNRMIQDRSQIQTQEELARAAAVCVRFQYLKAKAYYNQKDYWKSLEVMQEGIHAFPSVFPNLEDSSYLVDLATKAMTDRGLVRYTEPVLEKLLGTYDEQNWNGGVEEEEMHPVYQKILFAVGSASFQLSFEKERDDWGVSRVYPIEGEADV